MSRLLGSVLLALALSAGSAAAQAAADTVVQKEMRSVLRMIATTQEIHYSWNGTYTSDVKALNTQRDLGIGEGITVIMHFAHKQGWAAEALHPAVRGQSCVLWFGKADAGTALRTRMRGYAANEYPGRVLCDFDPPPVKR